jgi:hypothetical protein
MSAFTPQKGGHLSKSMQRQHQKTDSLTRRPLSVILVNEGKNVATYDWLLF